jgi:hypothetical protein
VRERDVELSVSPLPTLHADTTWLEQLFQNLLANAVKFSASVDPHVWVAARREGEAWCFTVADNGIGIDPDRAEEIFGVFRRLHEPYEYPVRESGWRSARRSWNVTAVASASSSARRAEAGSGLRCRPDLAAGILAARGLRPESSGRALEVGT